MKRTISCEKQCARLMPSERFSSDNPYRALWTAVLSDAVCTWVLLHPKHCSHSVWSMHKAWKEAHLWLFGPSCPTWELCELATGRTKGYVLRAASAQLENLTCKSMSVWDRMDSMEKAGIHYAPTLTTFRGYRHWKGVGAMATQLSFHMREGQVYGKAPDGGPRKKGYKPTADAVVEAFKALHSQGIVWVGVKLLQQKLNYWITARRLWNMVEAGELELDPAKVAYRLKEKAQ